MYKLLNKYKSDNTNIQIRSCIYISIVIGNHVHCCFIVSIVIEDDWLANSSFIMNEKNMKRTTWIFQFYLGKEGRKQKNKKTLSHIWTITWEFINVGIDNYEENNMNKLI